ncbi:MAG TPA: zf-HC2 domain-containing protein [Candidatus Krumholzibacteria bacterium]|nr:zf-HC2 domain-containing protein [Candidatus Krumholzibacteria bacterium]
MKCRRVRHLLLDFVDGLGNEAQHAEADRHLAECPDCEAFAVQTRESLALLRRVPAATLDENFNWKVRLAIHREEKANAKRAASTGAWVRAWNFRYVASTGVAFALVLSAGVVTLHTMSSESNELVTNDGAVDTSAPAPTPTRYAGSTTNRRPGPTMPGQLVSSDPRGADYPNKITRDPIDRFQQDVAIDSLFDARLSSMTPEMRRRCIQRQIHRLQSRLEIEPAAPADTPHEP